MKSLEEYKKEIEQDPKARRRLKKLEKEFQAVEESLTDEELEKYGLKPAAGEAPSANEIADEDDPVAEDKTDRKNDKANDMDKNEDLLGLKKDPRAEANAGTALDAIARKMF